MGGAGAPDDLEAGAVTQSWLAVSDDPDALVTGRYLYHQREREPSPDTRGEKLQEGLLDGAPRSLGPATVTGHAR